MSLRLFAAVLPPATAVAELAAAVRPLRELPGADGLRWTGPESWHFTLAFMGEVDEAVLPDLTVRLERAARRTEPFALRVHGGGRFGGRALWAGAAGGTAELCLLAARADAAARRAGAPMSEPRHVYRPHLTLARDRKGAHVDLQPYAEALRAFEGGAWEVGELALVHSRLPVSREPVAPGAPGERPSYETIARCRLGRSWRGHDPPGDGTVGGGR